MGPPPTGPALRYTYTKVESDQLTEENFPDADPSWLANFEDHVLKKAVSYITKTFKTRRFDTLWSGVVEEQFKKSPR